MSGILACKVAAVTGAGSGIGRASAIAFAREGARVVVSDSCEESGKGTVDKIVRAGGEALFIRADVSRPPDVEAMVKLAIDSYGRLDCAHNNAGVSGIRAATAELTEENWDRTIDTNLKGLWTCMKYELETMLEQGSGAIVNTASVAGLVGFTKGADYAASKHGVIGLTKTAALEYATSGIRVNAVCPGPIRTPMMERSIKMNPSFEQRMIGPTPMKRMGTPAEVADTVVWLCSDHASFVTGTAMPVDGGRLA